MAELYLEWAKENKSRDRDDMRRYEKHLKAPLGGKRLNEISSFYLDIIESQSEIQDGTTVPKILIIYGTNQFRRVFDGNNSAMDLNEGFLDFLERGRAMLDNSIGISRTGLINKARLGASNIQK